MFTANLENFIDGTDTGGQTIPRYFPRNKSCAVRSRRLVHSAFSSVRANRRWEQCSSERYGTACIHGVRPETLAVFS
jgi:hypothetical protein